MSKFLAKESVFLVQNGLNSGYFIKKLKKD